MRLMTISLTLLLGLLGSRAYAQAPIPGQPYAIPPQVIHSSTIDRLVGT